MDKKIKKYLEDYFDDYIKIYHTTKYDGTDYAIGIKFTKCNRQDGWLVHCCKKFDTKNVERLEQEVFTRYMDNIVCGYYHHCDLRESWLKRLKFLLFNI